MQVQEGKGWRLVIAPSRSPFPVLIGGECWAAELSAAEAAALRRGCALLLRQHAELAASLMAEESIELDLELELDPGALWLSLEGDRRRWRLRFVLTPSPGCRGLEGGWSSEASEPFAAALELASAIADLAAASLRPA
jgi:hypothetical protein